MLFKGSNCLINISDAISVKLDLQYRDYLTVLFCFFVALWGKSTPTVSILLTWNQSLPPFARFLRLRFPERSGHWNLSPLSLSYSNYWLCQSFVL
jgi:hypothetical protein